MRRFARLWPFLAILAPAALGQTLASSSGSPSKGWSGRLDGTWHWVLPDTPNGLTPTQSWHATSSSPAGDIYVAGMDHETNSALYHVDPVLGTLRYVGDARSASEAARNWKSGETAEKFHTRPLWHRGKMYVATMDRSSLDDEYLHRRGFHWYAYDPTRNNFEDLSANEPGGTGDAHGDIVTLASDPDRNVIYGAGVPTGTIYKYDVARGRTVNLGRPSSYDQPYVYTGRVMWVDSRGRLYFTAADATTQSDGGHIHYYDPKTGFGEQVGWTLQDGKALEVGQCLTEGRRCFFSDDKGHVYRYDVVGPSWSYVGQIRLDEANTPERYIWLFDVTSDGKKAYVSTSTSPQSSVTTSLYEFNLESGKTLRLCAIADLDPALLHLHIHTGYNAWDSNGRFYFASFNGQPHQPVILTRVDPKRLKAALNEHVSLSP
jgi:hypothetical protein